WRMPRAQPTATSRDRPSPPGAGASDIKQVLPMRIDPAQVAAAQGEAQGIEEIEDLDGHLATVVHAIAERSGAEPAVVTAGGQRFRKAGHFADHLAGEEVVVRDLVDLTLALHQLQDAADVALVALKGVGKITHAWRPETAFAEQLGLDPMPDQFI